MTDTHRNDERTVHCPVESCDKTPLARGINLHLNRTDGKGHAPRGEVPDHIDLDELETAGEEEVAMEYPEERDTEDVARLCPYCVSPYKGKKGVLIHLGQVAGRKNHPEDAAEKHSASEFPRVKLDQFGNIMSVPDESDASDEPGDSDHADTEKGAIPRRRVYRLIAELTADREPRTVYKVRKQLLGVGPHKRPIHDLPIHRDLYEEISGYLHSEKDQFDVTATLESNGLMIEYNGEKGLYTADEARDLAASFVRPANSKERATDRLAGLIRFLRYGADIIEEERVEQDPHENVNQYLEAMPVSRRVSERCHRCGDSTDVWVYEKIEPTVVKKHYACEMCGCEWTEVRQD